MDLSYDDDEAQKAEHSARSVSDTSRSLHHFQGQKPPDQNPKDGGPVQTLQSLVWSHPSVNFS